MHKKWWLYGISGLITLSLISGGVWFFLMRNTPKLPLPSNITTAITSFTPYFFDNSSVEGFKLIEDSVSYQAGVLVFTMKNDKSSKTLIFTEQKTPGNYDIGSLRGDKEFKTQYGQAFITDGTARTTGTLFTDDKTWILINAPQPIGADAMQKILSSLTSR